MARTLRVLSLLVLASAVAPSASPQTYTITDLGLLAGTDQNLPQAINESGQVAGVCYTPAFVSKGYVWSDGVRTPLPTLGGTNTEAYGIDDLGRAVGVSDVPGTFGRAFIWTSTGGIVDLGTITGQAGDSSVAYALSARGLVVGASTVAGSFPFHGFKGTVGGALTDLGELTPGGGSTVFETTDPGDVVGEGPNASFAIRPIRWNKGGAPLDDIGTLGGPSGSARDVNESGLIVGFADVNASGLVHAFKWDGAGGMVDLGSLAMGQRSEARAVNDSGVVVGMSETSPGTPRAFRWTAAAGMKNLNTLIPGGSGWTLQDALDVNDAGQIVGFGDFGGQTKGFLLTPTGCHSSLRPIGARIGGTLAFRFSSACFPGRIGFAFVSLTGKNAVFPFPSGVTLAITPDAFFVKFLALTSVSSVTLDGSGVGTTAGLPIPNNPFIVGLPMWAAGAVFDLVAGWVDGTSTNSFSLLP
jgi:probable HAF family extracellular repeat protein